MGIYFNPSNASFKKDRNYKIYVDKTELIAYLNEIIDTPKNCLAVSHARRFGKSHAAGMIDAYYSLGCNSSEIFDDNKDFKNVFGNELDYEKRFSYNLMLIYQKTNTPFVIIIDEWDCVIRNSDDKELVHKYLQFLHSLFKSEESKSFLALAYITGILPIKKIRDESALNNFSEYTMLKSKPITKYYGFTEDEVKVLCERFDMDFETVRACMV